ncbi:hypothetical protein DXG01_014502 [Tephrocybe rancida]|nr:hypothetical protein DXG01_014502 [Tephrocybe rancida]
MAGPDYISNLPAELLGDIFAHCLTGSPNSPLVCRSVSRTFNSVANSTPQFWTQLNLSTADDAAAAFKARNWFSRASSCPMSVRVHVALDRGEGALCAILSKYVAHIEKLSIHAPSEAHVRSLLNLVYFSPTPSSTPLHLKVDVEFANVESKSEPLLPRTCSSILATLALFTPTLPNIAGADFSSLQSFDLTRPIAATPIPMQNILQTIVSAPNLAYLHIETRFELSDEPVHVLIAQHDPLIALPKLSNLSLRTNNNPALLSILVCPILKNLRLNALDGRRRGRAEETASALRLLLLRLEEPFHGASQMVPSTRHALSTPGIELLELSGVNVTRGPEDELWDWCLRRMTSLRQITVRNIDAEHIIELLSQDICEGVGGRSGTNDDGLGLTVCPRLERLVVSVPEVSPVLTRLRALRPSVDVQALGFGVVWWSEDELKPKVIVSVERPTTMGREVEKTLPKGMEASSPSVEAGDPGGPTRQRRAVGGFGFGSAFHRRRGKCLTPQLS